MAHRLWGIYMDTQMQFPDALRFSGNVGIGVVTECNGAFYQNGDCCGIQADGDDDFQHSSFALLSAKLKQACAKLLHK